VTVATGAAMWINKPICGMLIFRSNLKVAYSGFFAPRNPQKYAGNTSNIIYRSLWERQVFVKLDEHTDVISWGSEEIIVPYRSPLDNRIHRYYPDVVYRHKTSDGSEKTKMVEIKPLCQVNEPKKPKGKKTSKKYIRELSTYLVNQAKWNAARAFCADKGWEFVIITEKELNIGTL
jgi:hypothetical protein